MAYGSGSLFQRGKKGIWYYQLYIDGRQIGPKSTKTSNRRKAQDELDKMLGKRARGEITVHTIKAGEGTLGAVLDEYLQHADADLGKNTAYIYRKTIEAHLREPFGHLKCGKLTSAALKNYRERRRSEGDSDSTVNRELSYLRAALHLQIKQGKAMMVPWFPMVDEKQFARQGFREEPEFLRFLDALCDDLKPFACCAFYGGMRRGELVALELADIDLRSRILTVRFTKNGEPRSVPIYSGPMEQWLRWLWNRRRPGQVKAFEFSDGRPITKRNFYTPWHAAAKKSGIGHFLPHDNRRSSNRRLAKEGVPRELRMAVHGWKTDDMDRRYQVSDKGAAEAVRAIMERPKNKIAPVSIKRGARRVG